MPMLCRKIMNASLYLPLNRMQPLISDIVISCLQQDTHSDNN